MTHGVVDAGDGGSRPGEVEVAGAVVVVPGPTRPLGVDPPGDGFGVRLSVGLRAAALGLKLSQGLGLGCLQ